MGARTQGLGRNLSEHSWTSIRTLFLVGWDKLEAAAAQKKTWAVSLVVCGVIMLTRDTLDSFVSSHDATMQSWVAKAAIVTQCAWERCSATSAQTGAAWVIQAVGQLLPCQHRLRP